MQPNYPPQPPTGAPGTANPAQTAGIIMLVCALLIAIGTFTKSWFSEDLGRGSAGIGLLGAKMCRGDECRSFSWDDMGGNVDGDIKAFGYIGFLGGLAALGVCAVAGGLALTRNAHKIKVKPLMIPLSVASGAMAYFLVRILLEDDSPGLSYSGFLALGGIIAAGAVLKQMLGPIAERARSGLPAGAGMPGALPAGAPPMAAPGAPSPMAAPSTCPRCGQPLEYVAQYQRYFCRNENQYV